MKDVKQSLSESEAVIQLDFSENFSFVVQDEIQSYHWENIQCTLHPIVTYMKKDDQTVSDSACILSDHKSHSTAAVHYFLSVYMPYLITKCPSLEKVHYFTDGCGGQYKNKYNLTNLCFHKQDFKIQAEWIFFATTHGRSACDGIGGTVKRLTRKASLQTPVSDQILTLDAIYSYCVENISGIKFFKVLDASEILEINDNDYVCCQYDDKFYIGHVKQSSEEHGDFFIQFMTPSCPSNQYFWPEVEDTCWVVRENIRCVIEIPSLTSSSSRGYSITESDRAKISSLIDKN